jgi:hypothetical protein
MFYLKEKKRKIIVNPLNILLVHAEIVGVKVSEKVIKRYSQKRYCVKDAVKMLLLRVSCYHGTIEFRAQVLFHITINLSEL